MQSNQTDTSAPTIATIEMLHKRIFKHPRIVQIETELKGLIYEGSQSNILMVCGPTGTGKTTLAEQLVHAALKEAANRMDTDAGLIPAVYVSVPSSGENAFSWRMLYQRILEKLDGSISAPRSAYFIDPASGRMSWSPGPGKNSLSALRIAVERGLSARQTRFLVLDEAGDIVRGAQQGDNVRYTLDALKSLSNDCGTQIVLAGSYDLYSLISLSGQLARRIHVLHFDRYRWDVPEDRIAFASFVQTYQDAIPQLWGNQLTQHVETLHHNVLGCIGTLSSVLIRSARYAEIDGKWSANSLKRALLTEAQRTRILSDITEGEQAIEPSQTRIWVPDQYKKSTRRGGFA